MTLFSVLILIFIFLFISAIGIYEVIKDCRNPLPKFENGDKRIENISIKKLVVFYLLKDYTRHNILKIKICPSPKFY